MVPLGLVPPWTESAPSMPVSRPPAPGPRSSSCPTSASPFDRLPIPSILGAGAIHTALMEAGLRGRTDLVVDAADVLDVHAMAMLLAVGATAVHPRLAIELAAELAGTRGAETMTRATISELRGRLRSRPAQDAGPDGDQRDRLVYRRLADRRPRPRRVRGRAQLPDGGGVARPDDLRGPGRAAAPPSRGRGGHRAGGPRPGATPPRSRLRPLPCRRR